MTYQVKGSGPPYFDGKNYQMWQERMGSFLRGKGQLLWDVTVDITYDIPANFLAPGSRDLFDANNKAVDFLYRALCEHEFNHVYGEKLACKTWEKLSVAHGGNNQVKERLLASYRREYENFTQLPGESIDVMFQRFTYIVNNIWANVTVLPYDDHDRAIKLLHCLDLTVWSAKVEAIMQSPNYETLTLDELFSKVTSSEVDRGLRGKTESPSDHHTLTLVSGHGARTNANSSPQLSLSCLMSMADEEFEVLTEEDLTLLSRRFTHLH